MRTMRITRGRADTGAAALIVAVCVAVLCGAGAISVDYGRSSYDKRRVQNAADAAARAIALDCAKKLPCAQTDANATARVFSDNNAGSDTTVSAPVLDLVNKTVTVTVKRNVKYAFAGALPGGPKSGIVSSTAQASWGAVPVSGLPVLPFAVPLCSVTQYKPPAGSDTGADHTYRTDLVNQVTEIADIVNAGQGQVNGALNGVAGVVGAVLSILGLDVRTTLDSVFNPLLKAGSTNSCGADPNIAAAQGGFWLTGLQGALPGTLNGLFPTTSAPCQLRSISTENLIAPLVSGARQSECYNLLGTTIKQGDTVLIPVYEPRSGANTGGLLGTPLSIDAGIQLLGTNTLQLNVAIVGFVPFTITEWDNGRAAPNKNETSYFSTQCDDTLDLGTRVLNPLLTPVTGGIVKLLDVLSQTTTQIDKLPAFNLVTWLLNTVVKAVTTTLNGLLPGLGDKVQDLHLTSERDSTKNLIQRLKDIVNGVKNDLDNVTLGCAAVRGHFTRQTEPDPRFVWDTPPASYPAALLDLFVTAKLIK